MKRIALLAIVLLAGCDAEPGSTIVDRHFQLPPEMAHCHIYHLQGDRDARYLDVVYCPNTTSITSEQMAGKTKRNVTVIKENQCSTENQ